MAILRSFPAHIRFGPWFANVLAQVTKAFSSELSKVHKSRHKVSPALQHAFNTSSTELKRTFENPTRPTRDAEDAVAAVDDLARPRHVVALAVVPIRLRFPNKNHVRNHVGTLRMDPLDSSLESHTPI